MSAQTDQPRELRAGQPVDGQQCRDIHISRTALTGLQPQ
jgi:hypothetical protein